MIRIEKIRINPLFADLIPSHTQTEYEALYQDIEQNGIRYPLIITEDYEILDGHTRFDIARHLEMQEVPIVILKTEADKIEDTIISLNLARRSLNQAQKCNIASLILKKEQEKAKERQIAKNAEQFDENGTALELAADKCGVKKTTLYHVILIKEYALTNDPIDKAWKRCLNGFCTINSVYTKVKNLEKEVDEVATAVKTAKATFIKNIKKATDEFLVIPNRDRAEILAFFTDQLAILSKTISEI